ncbi:MAG TPA: TIGR00296 family protein [archaeon]|nr:TIGR00296 family protein [archaeon]
MTSRHTSQIAEHHLTQAEGELLVRTARRAITTYLSEQTLIPSPTEAMGRLRAKSGVFVTLNTVKPTHELRGCIGFPYPEAALIDSTIRAAVYAATQDPRFPPVTLSEFNESIAVEITALTQPKPLETTDRKKLPDMVRVGTHGLIIEGMGSSGLLLPQVATEWQWDSSEFLSNCCMKAGLPPDSWLLDGVGVKVFEGEIFEELEPAGKVRRKTIGEQ